MADLALTTLRSLAHQPWPCFHANLYGHSAVGILGQIQIGRNNSAVLAVRILRGPYSIFPIIVLINEAGD
jgi:hypothetical protein